MSNHCLLIPDTMYVGRWYKLYAAPVKASAIPLYNYSVSGDAKVVADSVYILGVGKLTVTATTEDGETCTKVVQCEAYPNISRKTIPYNYTSWSKFKEDLEGYTEPTLVKFASDADIVADTDSTIVPATGCVIDFNNKNISIGTTALSQLLFSFKNDFCGVKNLYLKSTFPDWSTHTNGDKYTQASTLFRILGGFFELENFVAVNKQNYIISIGTWGHMTGYNFGYSQVWKSANVSNAKIGTNGELEDNSEWWSSTTAIPLCKGRDGRFCVGWLDHFIKGSYKTFSFALYDAEDNFISKVDNAQFYRSYAAPEEATHIRLSVCSDSAPEDIKGDDVWYIMRIYPSAGTREILLKNMRSMLNESGMVDVVGEVSELNVIACKCKSGKTNGWAFDFEDGWMSMLDVVMKSCFINGVVPLHSVQGFGGINSVLHTVYLQSWTANNKFDTCCIYNYTLRSGQLRGSYKFNNCTLVDEKTSTEITIVHSNNTLLNTQTKRAKLLTTVFGEISGW